MLKTIGRILVVLLGLIAAAGAAAAVLLFLGLERLSAALGGPGPEENVIDTMFEMARWAPTLFSAATMLPVVAAVILGEVARIRSAAYYVVAGGLALASIPLLARIEQADLAAAAQSTLWQLFATAGFAGGLVYWLLAGRRA